MPRDFRLRRRSVLIFLLPVLLVSWMLGWLLCYYGSLGGDRRNVSARVKGDGVEVLVRPLEEGVEVKN